MPDNLSNILEGITSSTTPLAHHLPKSHLASIPTNDLLSAYLHIVEFLKLYQTDNFTQWLEQNKAFYRSAELKSDIPEIAKYCTAISGIEKALLADFYLPNRVILCIRHLLQLEFGWNLDTANNLSMDSIKWLEDEKAYLLLPYKEEVGQQQAKRVDTSQPEMMQLLELIVENEKNIRAHWARTENSVFVSWGGKDWPKFRRFNTYQEHQAFIQEHHLPTFTTEQLRTQAVNTRYIQLRESVDPAVLMLGHSGYATANPYLDQEINRVLADANMREFMLRLSASIVWTIEGYGGVARRGMKDTDVNERLLFPIFDYPIGEDRERPVCDEWLADTNTAILIDRDTVEMAIRQRHYYASQWRRLYSDNPERFKMEHFPRIAFNQALCTLILESPYAQIYRDLENTLFDKERSHA